MFNSSNGQQNKENIDVDSSRLYKLLGVDPSAGEAEIRRAYRKAALKHHPDRGGDTESFKEIAKAYEVLSDPEKRSLYDRFGDKGLEEGHGSEENAAEDLLGALFGRRDCRGGAAGTAGAGKAGKRKKRPRTKDLVTPLFVSLEQLYNGASKKMAVSRDVVDTAEGKNKPKPCQACEGRGVKIDVIRMGDMVQQVQSFCSACGGQGTEFKTKKQREVLEVQVQKGTPEGHRISFKEKADEHPDADTGDVVFVVKQKEHPVFQRRGADLYMERTITLLEALCGFSLEVTHLDGRKLLIQTSPGDVTKPLPRGFDPLKVVGGEEDGTMISWETFEGCDAPGLENLAQAQNTDAEALKKVCASQLRRQGVDVAAFVVKDGMAYFKQGTRDEVLEKKEKCEKANLFVVEDPRKSSSMRLMKAVKGEGMPTYKNPFAFGNLFLILNIEFPEGLSPEQQEGLRKHLPAPAPAEAGEAKKGKDVTDDDVEVHPIIEMDPADSYNSNKLNMCDRKDATSGDDEEGEGGVRMGRGTMQQCAQQ